MEQIFALCVTKQFSVRVLEDTPYVMGVGAEMRINFFFFQRVGYLLRLGAVPAGKAAKVGLKGATEVF